METETTTKRGVGRIIAIVAVIGVFVALMAASFAMQESPSDKVWQPAMTVGDADPKQLYVMYTDLACPYCDVFSRATLEHWEEFVTYLEEHDILFEVRLTDALYLGNDLEMSRDSAEAAYCAVREDKFWEYYHGALTALWEDYHSKGIGNNKTAPHISDLPEDYWLQIGFEAGLGEEFERCVTERETAEQVQELSVKAMAVSDGMPTFKFGQFSTSGFSDTWGWEYVKMYLDAGLR